ncbi:MAG: hypothetical protein IPM32_14210 [Ignavibacteriae bacterium]|nr:hypothetical protein [Ignavibacteriota bacterium]
MNIASVDIGSNTVLLLIAKIENKNLIPLLNIYKSPRLGKDLIPGKKILDDRINNLLEILTLYKIKATKYNSQKILLKATNAMRIASNSDDICTLVKSKLDLDIEIIDGKTEAEFSFLGASSTFPQFDKKMVIDIGGGSTEIIYGNFKEIYFKHSFQTGVVSLTEKYFNIRPISQNDISKAEDFLNKLFIEFASNIPDNLNSIAVAGTPTTLSCIKQNLKDYNEKKVEGSFITLNELIQLKEKIAKILPDEMNANFGNVVEGRQDVLFAGILILESIMKLKKLDKIFVSGRGLRYGIIIDYINKLK